MKELQIRRRLHRNLETDRVLKRSDLWSECCRTGKSRRVGSWKPTSPPPPPPQKPTSEASEPSTQAIRNQDGPSAPMSVHHTRTKPSVIWNDGPTQTNTQKPTDARMEKQQQQNQGVELKPCRTIGSVKNASEMFSRGLLPVRSAKPPGLMRPPSNRGLRRTMQNQRSSDNWVGQFWLNPNSALRVTLGVKSWNPRPRRRKLSNGPGTCPS